MAGMGTAGFVLAGGRSARMGSDKALLELDGIPLLARVARTVAAAAGAATVIGDPARYGHLGLEVVADRESGLGPLGGILTALALERAEFNLVVACDMPGLDAEFLRRLLERAAGSGAECVMARSAGGAEPLCAVWSGRARAGVEAAVARGVRKVTEAQEGLQVVHFLMDNETWRANLNTPAEWERYRATHHE